MTPDIYTLGLLDSIKWRGWNITRVPGGWIFETIINKTATFVRYNNEFQVVPKVLDDDLPF